MTFAVGLVSEPLLVCQVLGSLSEAELVEMFQLMNPEQRAELLGATGHRERAMLLSSLAPSDRQEVLAELQRPSQVTHALHGCVAG